MFGPQVASECTMLSVHLNFESLLYLVPTKISYEIMLAYVESWAMK